MLFLIELNHWGTIAVYIVPLVNKAIQVLITFISCHISTLCCLTASSSEKDKPERLVLLDKLECLHWKWWGSVVELKWQRDFPSLSTSGISCGGPGSGDTYCVSVSVCACCRQGQQSRAGHASPLCHPVYKGSVEQYKTVCVLLMGSLTFYCKWWIMAAAVEVQWRGGELLHQLWAQSL